MATKRKKTYKPKLKKKPKKKSYIVVWEDGGDDPFRIFDTLDKVKDFLAEEIHEYDVVDLGTVKVYKVEKIGKVTIKIEF